MKIDRDVALRYERILEMALDLCSEDRNGWEEECRCSSRVLDSNYWCEEAKKELENRILKIEAQ